MHMLSPREVEIEFFFNSAKFIGLQIWQKKKNEFWTEVSLSWGYSIYDFRGGWGWDRKKSAYNRGRR